MCANRSIRGLARMRKNRSGFSLVELLAVMAIVAMLSTLAVTSYFSAIRGMASRSASDNFYNALMMARQRACIDGCRVSLMIFNEAANFDPASGKVSDLAASFVVCRELGRISYVSGSYLFDEFSDLGAMFQEGSAGASSKFAGTIKLYNLTEGAWSLVSPFVKRQKVGGANTVLPYSGKNDSIEAFALEKVDAGGVTWDTGDSYGIEVAPVKALPKGFEFAELNNTLTSDQALKDVKSITFEADGTAVKNATFTIRSRDANAKGTSFSVGKSGDITVSTN